MRRSITTFLAGLMIVAAAAVQGPVFRPARERRHGLTAVALGLEPVEPRRVGPFRIQGLFLRRQPEVAEVYAKIIADDIVTLSNIGKEDPHGDRHRDEHPEQPVAR